MLIVVLPSFVKDKIVVFAEDPIILNSNERVRSKKKYLKQDIIVLIRKGTKLLSIDKFSTQNGDLTVHPNYNQFTII